MEHFDYILRLLWLALWMVYEHRATGVVAGRLWDALLFFGGGAAMYAFTERVLKRVLPPAPSPAEDALQERVEELARALGRSEAGEASAREEACRAYGYMLGERRRADRLEADLRDALRPPRRSRPRARRKRKF